MRLKRFYIRWLITSAAACASAGGGGSASAQTLSWDDISGPPACVIAKRGPEGKTYVATNSVLPDYSISYGGKLLYSVDSGRSWQPTTLAYGWIQEVVVHGSVIIVAREIQSEAAPYQALLSTDGGVTWKGIFSNFFRQIGAFMIAASGEIYGLALNSPVGPADYTLVRYKSGRWYPVGSSLRLMGDYVTTAAIDSCGNVFFGTDEDGLFVSADSGRTWRQTLPARSISYLQAGRCGELLVGITPNPVVTGGVFRSADTARTWTLLGLAHNRVTSVAADDAGTVYASTDAGVFRYGGTPLAWQAVGPLNDRIDDMAASRTGVLVAVSATEGIFRSADGGATWDKSDVRGQDVSASLTVGPAILLAGTYGKGIFRSGDSGAVWSRASVDSGGEYVYGLARAGATLFAATETGLSRSADSGLTWTNVTQGAFTGGVFALAARSAGEVCAGASFGVYRSADLGTHWECTLATGAAVTSLAGDGQGTLLAATAEPASYRSADGGLTWSRLPLARGDIQSALVTSGGRYMFAVNGGVEVSSDSGATWSLRAFASASVYALSAAGGGYVAAGTGEGVYISSDDGEGWQLATAGIYQAEVLSVGVSDGGALLAGTYRGGLYRSRGTLTAAEDGRAALPRAAGILANYPNPFNPRTTISYELATRARVRLTVYDITGRQVALLADRVEAAGRHVIGWDAGDLPSGVYIARLEAGPAAHAVHKLLLAR